MDLISTRDRVRGCLIAGAAGDALGYAIEFDSWSTISRRYGSNGIRAYEKSGIDSKALVSDDTQMTLFTAYGMLQAAAAGLPLQQAACSVEQAYQYWMKTQYTRSGSRAEGPCWLLDVPELYSRRAPGNTCLSGLHTRAESAPVQSGDYIATEINNSKGCGGVMRTAPVGLLNITDDMALIQLIGAQCAAVTHSHPLGYIPAGILSHIVNRAVFNGSDSPDLWSIVAEARDTAAILYKNTPGIARMLELLDLAAELAADNQAGDLEHIRRLGEGWVGEEALAIAVYCALRYEHDLTSCLVAAVNHSGDSDSTGAIAGNIIGAVCGYEAMDPEWKADLELSSTILQLADDISACNEACGTPDDPAWKARYA